MGPGELGIVTLERFTMMSEEDVGLAKLGALPAESLPSTRSKWSIPKDRQPQKTVSNLRVTVVCGLMTLLVLRGTFGIVFTAQAQAEDHIAQGMDIPRRVLSVSNKELQEKHFLENSDSSAIGIFTFGPRISDWDEQRALWLQKHPILKKNSQTKDRMLLVTGSQLMPYENPVGDHLLLKSLKNKIDYCRLHDIDIFYNFAYLDHEMTGYWAKLLLLRKFMLTHPKVEWIWWMDSDAMFTNMLFEIPIEKYKHANMVLHGYDEMVYIQKRRVGLNTSNFLFRNCQWSLDLLDAWASMGPKGEVRHKAGKVLLAALLDRPLEFEADDQSALIYLLATPKQ